MVGCAIIDVTKGIGAYSYGESVEAGVFGANKGPLSSRQSVREITYSRRVLCGLWSSSQTCDTTFELRCSSASEEARQTVCLRGRRSPGSGEHLAQCGSALRRTACGDDSPVASVLRKAPWRSGRNMPRTIAEYSDTYTGPTARFDSQQARWSRVERHSPWQLSQEPDSDQNFSWRCVRAWVHSGRHRRPWRKLYRRQFRLEPNIYRRFYRLDRKRGRLEQRPARHPSTPTKDRRSFAVSHPGISHRQRWRVLEPSPAQLLHRSRISCENDAWTRWQKERQPACRAEELDPCPALTRLSANCRPISGTRNQSPLRSRKSTQQHVLHNQETHPQGEKRRTLLQEVRHPCYTMREASRIRPTHASPRGLPDYQKYGYRPIQTTHDHRCSAKKNPQQASVTPIMAQPLHTSALLR